MNDIELLQYVHETAEMGIEGLNSLDGQVRDDSLRRVLSQQGAEYRQIADQAERLLRSLGDEPRDPGLLAKVSAEVMSTFKTLADPSASNIAEMVIQGNTMGATKSTRHIKPLTILFNKESFRPFRNRFVSYINIFKHQLFQFITERY